MLGVEDWNNRELIGAYFGYKRNYFSTLIYISKGKWELMTAFDDRYLFASLLKYKNFLINLFYEASLIEMDMDKKEVEDVLSMIGAKSIHRYREFVILLNSVINEENFMTIQYPAIVKVLKFIAICNELGYSNLEVEIPIEINLKG